MDLFSLNIMEAYQYKIRKEKESIESLNLLFNVNDITLKNSLIKEVSYLDAKKIIIEYEWLKTMPLFNKHIFGIYFIVNGIEYLGGVVIYSEEYSANKSTTWNKYDFTGKILLLSRGVCLWWTPKNTASYFISKTLVWLRENTNYKIITATVDPAAGEIGTIYQSLNWYYVGLMAGNYNKNGRESKRFSVYINGKLRHSRSIRMELGTIKKDIILEKYPNAIFVPQYRKRRYFYFIGNKRENRHYHNMIKHLILPYPKRNADICGIIYLITNKINNKKYVGQTTRGFINRYNEYLLGAKCCNPYILKSIKKYGIENFDFTIIDTAQTLHELNYKEIKYISEFNTTNRNLGYNIESGGINSKSNSETIQLLSSQRKDVKQTNDWVRKRVEKIVKPVIKINTDLIILEHYNSLADAGKNNNNNLSYQSILRLCTGRTKQKGDVIWCYENDYINNTIPKYKKKTLNNVSKYTDEELHSIYKTYNENNISIRKLSEELNLNFSTVNNIIKSHEKKNSILNNNYTLICKITKKEFLDYKNKSGVLTTHIKKIYPDIVFESKFKRKQIEMKTGKPWYYEYFNWIIK